MAVKTQTQITTDHSEQHTNNLVIQDVIDSAVLRKGSDKVVDLTTTKTVSEDESGKIFTLDSAGGAYTITLPSVADGAGCTFTFVVKEDTPTADITISSNAANVFGNLAVQSDTDEDNRVACAGVTSVLVKTTALKGDSVTFIGTGAQYVVNGFGQVQNSFATA